ncbi:sigma-70 family RNA polymerase sigma factor [uncultured Jatrophihabitans sp.]|uniref:sigma-70 family RNA polymerase sigma factor n=1 Tax=uncultured Jatrophihabitans sp. TaxID=1610747 RepID=UPI0035CB545F
MPRRDVPSPGRGNGRGGLDALADLINDVLARRGTQPLTTTGLMLSAVESPASRPSTVRGRASRAFEPVPTPPGDGRVDGPDEASRSRADEPAMEDDHVETWRLVRLAQDGDGEAFGMLYDRYVDSVFRFIYYRVNDRALAEDFTSETFVRALRRISSISYQGRDIGAWFVTIARNIVLDHVKSARNRLERTTGDTIEGPEHEQSTESAVLDSLARDRLMEAVGQLGDEQRECVVLRFMQGLSVTETAAVMGKNDGAIKAMQHRAVRKLADLLGDDLR